MSSTTLIHLSDLHIGKHEDHDARLRLICSWISRIHSGARVLITGDLTENGARSEMREVRRRLAQLAETNPILCVPGNHDYAWHGLVCDGDAWAQWEEILGEPLGWLDAQGNAQASRRWMSKQGSELRFEGLGVWRDPLTPITYFGIDSGDPQDRTKTARGFVSRQLADALAPALQREQDRVRVVLLHHHLFEDRLFMKLVGANYLLEKIKQHCEIILFGHKHHFGLRLEHWPVMVASHSTTSDVFSERMLVNVIEATPRNGQRPLVTHRLEVVTDPELDPTSLPGLD